MRTVEALKGLNVPVLGIIPKIQVYRELLQQKKKNKAVYAIAGVYMLIALGVLLMELINRYVA